MSQYYDVERLLDILKMSIDGPPSAKLLAIDTSVRKEWNAANTGFEELLKMPKNSTTNITAALYPHLYYHEKSLLLTDNHNWRQIESSNKKPSLVIELLQKEMKFHFSD